MTGGYQEIGTLLRSAREGFHLSTHDVSEALHIRAIYLKAIEEGKFEQLPGAAYARGYLRSYAAYLDLDPQEILRQFEQGEAGLKRGFFLPQHISREKRPPKAVIWGSLGAAFAVYLIWLIASQPHQGGFSIVDNPFKKQSWPENDACFQPQTALYPPCHWVTQAALIRWPLTGQVRSVMDLADIK